MSFWVFLSDIIFGIPELNQKYECTSEKHLNSVATWIFEMQKIFFKKEFVTQTYGFLQGDRTAYSQLQS